MTKPNNTAFTNHAAQLSTFESVKYQLINDIKDIKNFQKKRIEEANVQPILTCLAQHCKLTFQSALEKQSCSFDPSSTLLAPTEQPTPAIATTTGVIISANGNTQYTGLSSHRPDAWIVTTPYITFEVPQQSTTQTPLQIQIPQLLLIGEAKVSGDDLDVARKEAIFKGSFVSPLFGYMAIYIAVTQDDLEIGLFSPLHTASAKKPELLHNTGPTSEPEKPELLHNTAPTREPEVPVDDYDPESTPTAKDHHISATIIHSVHVTMSELEKEDQVQKILSYLSFLTNLLFHLYQTAFRCSLESYTRYERHTNLLRTYLLAIKDLSLPAQLHQMEPTLCKLFPDFNQQASVWYTNLLEKLNDHNHAQCDNNRVQCKPHLLKRTLCDDDGIRQANSSKYVGINIDGIEKVYVTGPMIQYKAAATGQDPDYGAATCCSSSTNLIASSLNNSTQSVPCGNISHPMNTRTKVKVANMNNNAVVTPSQPPSSFYSLVKATKSAIYYSIVSVECDDESLFRQWGGTGLDLTLFNAQNFVRVGLALSELHSKGFVHCDIRTPNLVVNVNTINLVDTEYCCNQAQRQEQKLQDFYKRIGLVSIKHFEWFLNELRMFEGKLESKLEAKLEAKLESKLEANLDLLFQFLVHMSKQISDPSDKEYLLNRDNVLTNFDQYSTKLTKYFDDGLVAIMVATISQAHQLTKNPVENPTVFIVSCLEEEWSEEWFYMLDYCSLIYSWFKDSIAPYGKPLDTNFVGAVRNFLLERKTIQDKSAFSALLAQFFTELESHVNTKI